MKKQILLIASLAIVTLYACKRADITPSSQANRVSISDIGGSGLSVSTDPNGPRKLRLLVDDCCPDGGYCCIDQQGTCLPDVVITAPKPKFFANNQSSFRSATYVKDYFSAIDSIQGFADVMNPDSTNVAQMLTSGNYAIQVSENGASTVFLNVYPKDKWDGTNQVANEQFVFTIPVK